MAHEHPPTLQSEKLTIGPVAASLGIPGLLVGVVALGLAAYLGLKTGSGEIHEQLKSHFLYSYLAAYAFFLILTLGAILFVMIHYATRAAWSVTVRRLAEGLSLNIFLMIVLLIPIVWGAKELLEWLRPGVVASQADLTAKSGYLNPTFLYIRLASYFVIWGFIAKYFSSRSVKQDRTGDPAITSRLELASLPLIILFGYSLTGFAVDWIMGLNPHWFSTIFGVYIFAGAMGSAFASITLLSLGLQKRGLIGNVVNHDHYHDLGKWMLAFTVFWAYIAFAQYMLTWYSNMPAETQFYLPRQIGFWGSLSILLLLVHFVIPFPGLLSRRVKRRNSVIAFWALWLVTACALDVYWLVVPNEWIQEIPAAVGHPHMAVPNALALLLDPHNIYQVRPEYMGFMQSRIEFPFRPDAVLISVLCFVGVGGLYVYSTMRALRRKSLVPTQDPRLAESLAFENV